MKNKWEPFLNWLWSKKDVDTPFGPAVLTERNTDDSLPKPPLTITDSVNLFRLLEMRGLVFKLEEHLYVLNKVEEYKWDELVEEISRPAWKRHWITKYALSIILFLLAGIIGGIIGGYFNKVGEDLVPMQPNIQSAPNITPKTSGQNTQIKQSLTRR
jgi:hypothetical protein